MVEFMIQWHGLLREVTFSSRLQLPQKWLRLLKTTIRCWHNQYSFAELELWEWVYLHNINKQISSNYAYLETTVGLEDHPLKLYWRRFFFSILFHYRTLQIYESINIAIEYLRVSTCLENIVFRPRIYTAVLRNRMSLEFSQLEQ